MQEFLDEEEEIYTQILFIGGSGEISRDVQTFKEKGYLSFSGVGGFGVRFLGWGILTNPDPQQI